MLDTRALHDDAAFVPRLIHFIKRICTPQLGVWTHRQDIVERACPTEELTKYRTPLFAEAVPLQSKRNSKSQNGSIVARSPPVCLSICWTSFGNVIVPSTIFQPAASGSLFCTPRQPIRRFPSNNNFHPWATSASVRVLGTPLLKSAEAALDAGVAGTAAGAVGAAGTVGRTAGTPGWGWLGRAGFKDDGGN
jgi:hypothetical protein